MSPAARCLPSLSTTFRASVARPGSSLRFVRSKSTVATDACGIPLAPTWSVNALLSSYPTPTIAPATLQKLHALSALVPPAEGTLEHERLTKEMEGLVRLVEAVKLVDVGEQGSREGVPDGRVWKEGTGIALEREDPPVDEVHGRELLRWAAHTEDGMYVVDADRAR